MTQAPPATRTQRPPAPPVPAGAGSGSPLRGTGGALLVLLGLLVTLLLASGWHLTQGTSGVGLRDLLDLALGREESHGLPAGTADILVASRIPRLAAGVAVGFAPGTPQADGTVSVGLKDAHAWPELYFEGVGWTRFEPTPTRGTTPSYTLSDTPGSSVPDEALPSKNASAAPSASASASESCSAQLRKQDVCASPSAASATTPSTSARVPPRMRLAMAVMTLSFL